MRNILFLSALFLLSLPLTAQQDAMFTRNTFNSMYLFGNPAYCGVHGYWTSNALYRTQWLGFEGAPQTIYLGAEGMVGRRQNAGLGFSLMHDKIGLDRMTHLSANYAYHIRLDKDQTLSLGLKAGAFYYKSLLGSAILDDNGDPVYSSGDVQGVVPHVGVGVYWYTPDFFAGVSMPTLFAFDKRDNGLNFTPIGSGIQRMHLNAYTGYVFHLDNRIDLKPSLLLKYQPAAPLEADINLNVWFNNVIAFGASYRTNDAVSIMIEVPINKRLSVAYAFDHTITPIRKVSDGTHELMVGYNFINDLRVTGVRRNPGRF